MLAVTRFALDGDPSFADRATVALHALAACQGYRSGRLARSIDEPARWVLVTEWASVGAYRRALGSYDVRVNAARLLGQSEDEPSAYEILTEISAEGTVRNVGSDRSDLR